jgi:hypothetical protein
MGQLLGIAVLVRYTAKLHVRVMEHVVYIGGGVAYFLGVGQNRLDFRRKHMLLLAEQVVQVMFVPLHTGDAADKRLDGFSAYGQDFRFDKGRGRVEFNQYAVGLVRHALVKRDRGILVHFHVGVHIQAAQLLAGVRPILQTGQQLAPLG